MADKPNRPRPFRLRLPFRAKPSPTPLRPPIPPPQPPLPQTPAFAPLPPAKPKLPSRTQPKSPPGSATTAAGVSQPPSPLPASVPTVQSPTTAERASQPSRPTQLGSKRQLAIQKASTSPSSAQDASQTQQAESQLLSQPLPPKSPTGSTSSSNQPELLPNESPTLLPTKSPGNLQLQTFPQTQEMNPIQPASKPTDDHPAQEIESNPKPVNSPSKLDKQPGKLLESVENSKPASQDRIIEGFNEDKSKAKPEIQPQQPQTEAGDEPRKRNEARPSSIASDTMPTSSPTEAGEIKAELRISKPQHSRKQDNLVRVGAAQNGSSGKESKIAISTMPRASFSDGERAPFAKEIKEGLSRLVLKLDFGHLKTTETGQPASVITLAGENNGASMVIGLDTYVPGGFKHPKGNVEATCDHVEERWKHRWTEDRAITATINSNAQSINNSALHSSSCDARDPGVHLNLSSKKVETASPRGQIEPLKPQKTYPRIIPEQRPAHEPRIRRRCLRALFLESSESDPENPQKPRRHGCRFCCEDKKKGKADTDATSTANSTARARQTEQGTGRA